MVEADDVHSDGVKGAEEAVEFDLRLGVITFAIVPRGRNKTGRETFVIRAEL